MGASLGDIAKKYCATDGDGELSDKVLRDKIAANPNVVEFRRLCIERGMTTLRDDGFSKVREGRTTVEEVLRVTEATI